MNYNRGYCSLLAARENAGKNCGVCRARPDGADNALPRGERSLAMVYSPVQSFADILPPCEALKNGTVFKKLVLPFYGERGMKGACL